MSLLRAETRKLARRKLYPAMVAVLAVFTLIAAFFTLLFEQIFPGAAEGLTTVYKPEAYEFGMTQIASQAWFPMLLAAVAMGSELSGTVWATALTREASVLRHVLARLVAYVVAAWVAFLIAVAVWSVFAYFFAEGTGGPALTVWLDHFWKLAVVAAAWTSLGLGAVAMLRSVGPAIGAVLGFYFFEQLISLWDAYEGFSATAASISIFGLDIPPGFEDFIPGGGMSVAHATLVLAGWTALGFLLTWWGLRRKDA
ncbi:MAG: hypothetical protein J5I28_06075 [Acidimicrobiales bacterium]|nr:hypothetical protein [Acidimicrobiales bacterium]HLV90718.1 hypothetical protein [Acidimicrobiia bacterium]